MNNIRIKLVRFDGGASIVVDDASYFAYGKDKLDGRLINYRVVKKNKK